LIGGVGRLLPCGRDHYLSQRIGFAFPNVVVNNRIPVGICVGDNGSIITRYCRGIDFRTVSSEGISWKSQKRDRSVSWMIPDAIHP
jgi:hypothetical protein